MTNETPEEMYERLDSCIGLYRSDDYMHQQAKEWRAIANHYRNQVMALREALQVCVSLSKHCSSQSVQDTYNKSREALEATEE